MMGKHLLLDCTLRDGGYINDWNFGRDTLVSVYSRIVSSGVDIIEVGFWMSGAHSTKTGASHPIQLLSVKSSVKLKRETPL